MAGQDPNFQGAATPGGITSESTIMLNEFWSKVSGEINLMNNSNFKTHELPLARIKKIMKLDEDVKMISAEAPVLFAKAAEIFISELSLRAWVHTEDNKRRTLQRNDIAMAISKFDQFDFLIDIVPREELKPAKRQEDNVRTTSMMADQVQYYFQLAQQATGNLQQQPTQTAAQTGTVQASPVQATQATTQAIANQLQVPASQQIIQQPFQIQLGQTGQAQPVATNAGQAQTQVIQVQAPAQQQQQQQQQPQQIQLHQTQPAQQLQQQTTQVFQQVISPSGEVQNVPIQLTPAQFQAIQLQLQGKQSSQPIVIQTPQSQPADVQFTAAATQQPMFQIQQLPSGQQVYIQHTAQGGGDGTDQQTDGQDTT